MVISIFNLTGDVDMPCEKMMDSVAEHLRDSYDYIIIDCGLKHELLTVNALAASDYCIIPVQAHFLASEGIPDVLKLVQSVRARFNPRLKIAGILLTMYQSRPQLCQSVRSSVGEINGDAIHVFERPIEQTIKIAECWAVGKSILEYAPKNPAAESYRSLAREVLQLSKATMQNIVRHCPPPTSKNQAILAVWQEAKVEAEQRLAAPAKKITFNRKKFEPYLSGISNESELEALFLEFLKERAVKT